MALTWSHVPAEPFSMGFGAWVLQPRPSEGPRGFRTQIGFQRSSGSTVAAAKWRVHVVWQPRTNVWQKGTSPGPGAKRLRAEAAQERGSAMNNLEYVRKCKRIKRTPNDAGTKLTIEFGYYDNGSVWINGSPKGDYTLDEAQRWLASTRFVMQMIEEI